ncbi:MAG: FUSC family protein [Burkholderiales bacterium]|nr:FUSC family protein [Burkholderiales bacterium]
MNRNPTDSTFLARLATRLHGRTQNALRVALSQYVANGLSVALGLVLIMLALFESAGLAAAASAAVGVIITSLPDVPSPRRRKIMQVLPAPVLGMPLFLLVQLTRQDTWLLGGVLVGGTFLAVMMMAWGKRGGPICFSLLFSMLFSMAAPPMNSQDEVLLHTGWFAAGASLYLLWAVLTTHLLNRRFRAQLLAECLYSFASILRTQAQRFGPGPDHPALLEAMLDQQASFADQLQDTRNVVLESPTTRPRQQYAAMLLGLLEARDHQLACDLDLDVLLGQQATAPHLPALQQALNTTADELQALGMALLMGWRQPSIRPIPDLRPQLAGALPPRPASSPPLLPQPVRTDAPDAPALLRNMADRIGHINDEAVKIAALARGDLAPELSLVRNQWQLFVSATTWSWKPLLGQLDWRAPTLRYALRATLAVATGYGVSLHLPWATHEYWILITIVVVMRGNLAQTVQRRNARVAGTVLGCLLVMALLMTHPGAKMLFLIVALSTGMAHAFALRRYLYTTIAATVSGLLQAHLLLVGLRPTFAMGERLADTLLGALLAWLFSYVLPSWERNQIPGLVRRSIRAQGQHAKLALALLDTAQTADVNWRLARREAYDSLSALTLATQRSLAEPRQVRPPLEPLEALQARSYQLLAQLTAVKSLLLLRRGQLDLAQATPALERAAHCIEAELSGKTPPASNDNPPGFSIAGQPYLERPDMLVAADLTPWLLRRLQLACAIARELRLAASRVHV